MRPRATMSERMPSAHSTGCNRKRTAAMPVERILFLGIAVLALNLVTGCASTTVSRVDTASVTDLSGRWNDTDSRLVAEAMIKEAISQPWLDDYTKTKGRQPVVIVGTIA